MLDIPLLLAGPILRRVEPTVVSVWLALSKPATVRLILWEGRVLSGSDNPLFANPVPGVRALRIGASFAGECDGLILARHLASGAGIDAASCRGVPTPAISYGLSPAGDGPAVPDDDGNRNSRRRSSGPRWDGRAARWAVRG